MRLPGSGIGHATKKVKFIDARANLKRVIDRVVDDMDVTPITRRDAPNAIAMSEEYYDSLMETVYLLRSPADVAHLRASKAKPRWLAEGVDNDTRTSRNTPEDSLT